MGTVKTTIVIDEETWNAFRKFVSSKYGSLRKVSLAVEEAMKCFNAVEIFRDFSNAMGLAAGEYPSVREVRERRLKLGTLSGKEVRGIRDEREARLS